MSTLPGQPHSRLRRIRNFLGRPWADKWLFVQAYLLLGVTRLAINTMPFPRLARYFGSRMVETPEDAPVEHLRQARRVAWAIRRASPYTPWNSNCFPQALTAKILLRRRRIPSTLYLGSAIKKDEQILESHAWLRCGSLYVTGGNGRQHFAVLAAFGDDVSDSRTGM
ncbi:MAG: lasso peptide biosynthesis B2 protein [Caldilineaceae bacterium]|nr:lasso peptide biosynthesis B2 protein [Caldilineaceae bacterium]